MKNALVIDYKYCDQCNSCVVACQMEHGFSGEEWGIQIKEIGPEEVDGSWMWDYLPYLSKRCDLCADRVAEGRQPSCVQHCLSACIELVPLDQLPCRLEALGDRVAAYVQ